jgi:hypothetical protein
LLAAASVFFLFARGALGTGLIAPSSQLECREYDRGDYSKAGGRSLTAITLTSLASDAKEIGALQGGERLHSPRGTGSVVLRKADTAQSGPWNTTVYVLGNRARPAGLKIVFKDHASGGVRVSWLNEKLFLSVWWGRIASTDLILDIETSKYVYVEDADYGTLILPCAVKVKIPK